MATRSTISIKLSENEGKQIYCHWDGYPSNNGAILKKHYATKERVMELMELGDISILGETIGTKVDFDGFDSSKNSSCLAYGRDRGEKNVEARKFKKLPKQREEYNYLFDNGIWFVATNDNDNFIPLIDEMITEN